MQVWGCRTESSSITRAKAAGADHYATRQAYSCPIPQDALPKRAVLREENGAKYDVDVTLTETGWQIPAIQTLGYHSLEVDDQSITIAVAPSKCPSVRDLTRSEKIWGLAAQIYAVRRPGDCGIGDAGGVVELAARSAALGADVVALSPSMLCLVQSPDISVLIRRRTDYFTIRFTRMRA